MIDFFNRYIHPSSNQRSKLAIYFVAQAKSDVSTKQITELIKGLELDTEASAQAATDLQARLSAAAPDEEKEVEGLKSYLFHDLKVTETKIDAAVEIWRKIHAQSIGTNGIVKDAQPPSSNGIAPVVINDVRDFKAGLTVTAGARPVKDLSEYEELDPKL